MEEMQRKRMENDLRRDDIRLLVRRIALPGMLAQFVSVLYSIVDRMYIGHIPEIGEVALAGVGVCGPVVTMIGSVASLVGLGGAPLMSIRMGEGDEEGARKILSNCFVMLSVFAVALMAAVIPLRRPMLMFFGASEDTLPYADEYFLWYMTGTVFALLATGMNSFVTAQGFARKAMFSVLLGAVMNIVLDPVFIFALDMGVRGAAIATVISQAFSCAYALRFLLGRRAPIRIERPRLESAIIRRVLLLGFTPFSIIAVDNAMIIAMNAVLQRYGGAGEGDLLITVATIVQSFMLVVTMPLGGISGGTQPILSFNYGAPSAISFCGAWRLRRSCLASRGWRGRCLCAFSRRMRWWWRRLHGPSAYTRWRSFPWACNTRSSMASRPLVRCATPGRSLSGARRYTSPRCSSFPRSGAPRPRFTPKPFQM